MIARLVRVHGHVQGVTFRQTCQSEAESRGVTGWARNEADGTVSAWFEGEEDAVDAMVAWCRKGPRSAQVAHLDVEDVEPEGRRDFAVG